MLDGRFTTKFLPLPTSFARREDWKRPLLPAKGPVMSRRTRYTQAAGSVLAISIIAGAVAGSIVGQPSVGFLAGLAAGILLAILFWLNERRR